MPPAATELLLHDASLTTRLQMPLFEQLASINKPATAERASSQPELAARDANAQTLRPRRTEQTRRRY